ncbi:hypothetical protein J31TS4_44770 [Paenibacillus sp. J31TS4]|uniref:hypothetical protein n=1 Tax=Paenibacillus sp. J31TS4 TaxID=2807195 RepID=UPI001B2B8242|nr:hypothetical protein [Paenibacillus sp. J31TS4]GIP41197.1 hypothetical protein J31TS4_44770 [Paenibacillus sp. J31TS4]
MNKMSAITTKAYVKVKHYLSNEKGAQSLEWLGLAALLIMVLGIISTALNTGKGTIGEVISKIFENIKNQLGGS